MRLVGGKHLRNSQEVPKDSYSPTNGIGGKPSTMFATHNKLLPRDAALESEAEI